MTSVRALPPVRELLPQAGSMVLVDAITSTGNDFIECSTVASIERLFGNDRGRTLGFAPDEIPSWIGIEFMAQTVAAFAGLDDTRSGKPVSIGYLLGTRDLELGVAAFADGQELIIRAERLWTGGGMGVFGCEIRRVRDGKVLARSEIKVYRPSAEKTH